MSLKESSDELNPTELAPEVLTVKSNRGPIDYLALAIATFGVGFLPLAPGTWGSLVGVASTCSFAFFFLTPVKYRS